MTRFLIGTALLTLVLLSGCAMARHREQIRSGLLTTGLNREAFLQEWGPPARTSTTTGEEITRAGFRQLWGSGSGAGSGFFVKGKQTYDVWEYDSNITLVFENHRLTAWKTEMTVSQIREWSATRARSR